ncbi:MAG: zinc ribbon domain-containing protein [Bacteroidales bacterium]|nr:zinc ribbon domain-containing protein [Candidatus Sodaliphilus aphodohippi]
MVNEIYKCKDCGKVFKVPPFFWSIIPILPPQVHCPECRSTNTEICLGKTLKALLKGEYGGKAK